MKRLSIACVLASLAMIAVPAAASALYYPSGPQAFVDKSQLEGWQLCFSDLYGDTDSLSSVLTQCNGDPLLLAGGPTGSPTLTVLAAAPRADVIFDTGTGNTPHNANGTGWYFNSDWSWGFAKQGDPIDRTECDVQDNPNPDLRLCWHTLGGNGSLSGGYRAGAVTGLNDSTDYTRYVYEATPPSNSFTVGGVTRNKKKGTATITVNVPNPGELTGSGDGAKVSSARAVTSKSVGAGPAQLLIKAKGKKKRKLNQKGKVKLTVAVTYTPTGGDPSTQSVKVKLKKKL